MNPEIYVTDERQLELVQMAQQGFPVLAVRSAIASAVAGAATGLPASAEDGEGDVTAAQAARRRMVMNVAEMVEALEAGALRLEDLGALQTRLAKLFKKKMVVLREAVGG